MRKLRLDDAKPIRALIQASVSASGEQRFLHRLHCALLVAEGRSCYEVARWVGANPRTVERWVHAVQAHGVDGLREHHSGGRPSILPVERFDQLYREIGQRPLACGYGQERWHGPLLARHLLERYGVRLSIRECQRLLRRVGTRRMTCP